MRIASVQSQSDVASVRQSGFSASMGRRSERADWVRFSCSLLHLFGLQQAVGDDERHGTNATTRMRMMIMTSDDDENDDDDDHCHHHDHDHDHDDAK